VGHNFFSEGEVCRDAAAVSTPDYFQLFINYCLVIPFIFVFMRAIAFFLLYLMLNQALAQRKTNALILEHSAEIHSINPADSVYDDLEVLGSAIGDSRIVMLGEQSHGDAAAFQAKTRIIKYLHEKKGFNVLVFESDFYGLNEAWEDYFIRDSSVEILKHNIYSIWSGCNYVSPLFDYIDDSKSMAPLYVAGMDTRHSLRYSRKHYSDEFKHHFKDFPEPRADSSSFQHFIDLLTELIRNEYKSTASPEGKDFFVDYLNKLKEEHTADDFWKQELNNLAAFANNSWKLGKPELNRDAIMAQNLLWIYRHKYKGEKLIVWAHNGHVARDLESFKTKKGMVLFPDYTPSLGDVIHRELSDSLYSIGFVSNEGFSRFAAWDTSYSIGPYNGKNYERLMADQGYSYAFTDLRAMPAKSIFYMRGIMPITPFKKEWKNTYDGVFFIREMYGCGDPK